MRKQRGISLVMVAVVCAGLALAAMVAMMSMRHEKNYFAEGLDKAAKAVSSSPAGAVLPVAEPAGDRVLKKCVINGQTVISNTDCKADNKTTRVLANNDTKGVVSPPKPAASAPSAAAQGDPALDKAIDKATGGR
ncbi:MAG: DUF4124 domain-containing protein [Telluria sp.]